MLKRRNGQPRRQTLKALTDPQPEFVSLVFGGANKTPFRVLRADCAAEVEETMKTASVARVEFSGNKFADEAAVKEWLIAGGYDSEIAIAKTDDGFVVATDEQVDESALSVIDMSDSTGVMLYTVGLKNADDDELKLQRSQELHPGATEEMVQRYCGCVETCSSYDGKTVAEVMSDTNQGVPPGMLDLTMALYDAMRNCIREGDYAGAKAAISEFSRMVDALTALFPRERDEAFKAFVDALAPEIEMSKEATPANETVVEATEKTDAVEQVTENVENVEKTDENKDDTTAVVEKTDAAEGDKGEGGETVTEAKADEAGEGDKTDETAKAEKSDGNSDDAVDAAKSDDAVAALTALVGELTASVKSMGENLSSELNKVVERVAAVEDGRQTRKGADVDETAVGKTAEADVSKGIADLRTRSVLGMRGPVSK